MNIKSNSNILINPNDVRIKQKLSLRKQQNSKRLIIRILSESISQSVKCLEFEEEYFTSIQQEVKERILSISYKEIVDMCNDIQKNKEILFLWISSMRKTSLDGDREIITQRLLSNLTIEKVSFLLNILIHSINGLTYEEEIKLRYEICCILINLLIDTDKYNDIYIKYFEDIFNYTKVIIKGKIDDKINVLLYHIQWLISNIIEDKEMYANIKENCKIYIPDLILSVFQINTNAEPNLTQTNIWTLNNFLSNSNIEVFIQYKLFIIYINDIMNLFICNLNFTLLNECFYTLNIFALSAECVNFILNECHLSIINYCFKFYNLSKYIQRLLFKLALKDEYNALVQKHQIVQKFIIPIFQEIDLISNEAFNDKEKQILINVLILSSEIINKSFSPINTLQFNNQMLLHNIQKLYYLKDVKISKSILLFYQSVFKKGDITIRAHFCKNKLHIFLITELKKYYDIKQLTHVIIETISIILNILLLILKFSEEIADKFNFIQSEMEDVDIIDLLTNLQYFPSEEIYSVAINILEPYWPFE